MSHPACGTCHKQFYAGVTARNQHCSATGHGWPAFECDSCWAYFGDEEDRVEHMEDFDHFRPEQVLHECRVCDDVFQTKALRSEHEIDDHHYCSDCDRHFMNYNNIQMHLRSRVHLGEKAISCPFCSKGYTTATGMTHHLESGACPRMPNLNRDEIYRAVRSRDPNGVISKKLIGWNGSSTYEANARSWNGYWYECYLCHNEFNSLAGLNQHLNSPRHQQDLYHCPNSGCGQDFKSLASVINHLESESCGFMRFRDVQNRARNMISGGRLLGY